MKSASSASRRAPPRRSESAACASSRNSWASEPERRDVGRLVVRGVLADGLAERRGRGLLVENVVDHLKSESDAFRVVIEARKLPRRERARAARAERDRRADQRSGLVNVHVFELGHGQGLAYAREIDRL